MLSIVVLISGSGSNLRALLKACDNPLYPAKILAVGADSPAKGLEHAEEFGVPSFVVAESNFASRELWAQRMLEHIQFLKPDLVVLAGFMKVLPENFVSALSPNLINLHPSLLPLFPGAHAVQNLAEVTSVSVKLRPGNNDVVVVGTGGARRIFLA